MTAVIDGSTTLNKAISLSMNLFVCAVDSADNLNIVHNGTRKDGTEFLVVENDNIKNGVEGHQCEVDVSEIFAKIKTCVHAQEFIDVINTDRAPVILNGITRIVGYYSRTHNWNKSKIGELRDRQKGRYGTDKHEVEFKHQTMQAVDALSA